MSMAIYLRIAKLAFVLYGMGIHGSIPIWLEEPELFTRGLLQNAFAGPGSRMQEGFLC